MRLSASRMATWMECPKKAHFRYTGTFEEPKNAAASFGTCVHHALDFYNQTQDIDGAISLFDDVWNNPEKLDVVPEVWPRYSSFTGYLEKGIAALRDYHEQLKWGSRTVLATEHKFLVPFGKHELTGFVDCLEIAGSKKGEVLKVVDYKTNGRAPYMENLRLNIQFTIYHYASLQPEFWLGNGEDFPPMDNGEHWWTFTEGMPRKNIWYGLMQKKEFDAGPRKEADFMRLYRVADEIERAIEHEVYVPNISGDSCGFCPFWEPCGLPISREEVLEIT